MRKLHANIFPNWWREGFDARVLDSLSPTTCMAALNTLTCDPEGRADARNPGGAISQVRFKMLTPRRRALWNAWAS